MLFGMEPTPEQRAHMERQAAERVAFRNDVKHMMQDIDTHHLWLLKTLLFNMSQDGDTAHVVAANLAGMMTAYLEQRGKCGGCGIDHQEEELRQMMPQSDQPAAVIVNENSLPVETAAALDAYNVALLPDGRVICKGPCEGQSIWSSLDERMKSGPEDCVHCIQKAKWG